MAKTYNLGDLRAAIEEVIRSIAEESRCGQAANDQVLARLKSDRQSLVSFFTPQLVNIALTKLLNDVCKRRTSPVGQEEHDDLFSEYGKIPSIVTVTRGLKKDTANLRLFEARGWLEKHSSRLVENDHEDFRKLLDRIEPYARSENETILDILHRMKQSERAKSEDLLPAE